MTSSLRWPRAEYLKNLDDEALLDAIASASDLKVISDMLFTRPVPLEQLCSVLRMTLQTCSGSSASLLQMLVMTPDDIKDKWAKHGAASAAAGTWVHLQCECVLNGGLIRGSSIEMTLFQRFLSETEPLVAWRTEWCIWASEERLAGMIDFVAMNLDGDLVLFDWKRTKGLPTKMDNTYRSLYPPLNHLPDATGVKYRLQLNIYRCILQKYYHVKVAQMFVVCLHPEHESCGPWIDEVPEMECEAMAIMQEQRKRVCVGCMDACGGALPAAFALLPAELCGVILSYVNRAAVSPSPSRVLCLQVFQGSVGKLLPCFLEIADADGFWSIPGPENLTYLCKRQGADALGGGLGESDDDDCGMPEVGEAAQEEGGGQPFASPSSRHCTAAKSQPRPRAPAHAEASSSRRADAAEVERAEPKAESDDDALPLADASLSKLKLRRMMPGAATSEDDFTNHFIDLELRNQIFQAVPVEAIDRSDTILHITGEWTQRVKDFFHERSEYFVRICVGVLAFSRVRENDTYMRDDALVYWIAEGGTTLRFHAGDCYMRTPSGAFQQHRGVPPDHARVQTFLLHVEGTFKRMRRTVERDARPLLEEIGYMFATDNHDETTFLEKCIDACLTSQAQGRRRRDDEEGDDALLPWNSVAAKTVIAVKRRLSREVTEEKLLHYMTEWCDTPCTRQPSCCYDDCAVAYDHGREPALQVKRDELKNCYLRIPHCIKGVVPEHVVQRLHKFYRQTFWGNIDVFKCCQAAQALAKRGINVTRVFIGISRGGVGQSLYSLHLKAMFAHNFAFFDPNIWFNEDEMRKQVEQLNGCCVLTGQETPATGRKLREDLFKKFASADGIAGRKPYGFLTRMIHCTGWKRLEANRMLQFADVSERNLNSLLRRCFIWIIKSRFEDAQSIAAAYDDIEKDGVFAKDPELAEFLSSPFAVVAGLQLQHAFEEANSKQKCLDMIEEYVSWGGDGGLTEQILREACGLKQRDVRSTLTRAAGAIVIDEDPEQADETAAWNALRRAVANFMLEKKKLGITPGTLSGMRPVKDGPNVSKDAMCEGLLSRQMMLKISSRTRVSFVYMPVLKPEVPLDAILDHQARQCEMELPEKYGVAAFWNYLYGSPFRKENADILASVLKAAMGKKRAGRPGADEVSKQKEELVEAGAKLAANKTLGEGLLSKMLPKAGPQPAKRRRVKGEAEIKREDADEIPKYQTSTCTYHYTGPPTIRGRKQVSSLAAQKFSRRAQMHLLAETYDLDIYNSAFTLLSQLLDKARLEPALPGPLREALELCVQKRDEVCEAQLHKTRNEGKLLLTSLLFGAAVPGRLAGNDFVQNLHKVSLYMRWAGISFLREEYDNFAQDTSGKRNPDNSTLAHLYFVCEDVVLTAWTDFLVSKCRLEHLSLHYDGVRISKSSVTDLKDLCTSSSKYIEEKTGFCVKIREKQHKSILQLLKDTSPVKEPPFAATSPVLKESGNCILYSVVSLAGRALDFEAKLSDESLPANVYREQRKSRTYKQCAELMDTLLYPMLLTGENVPSGKFLMHTENGQTPHCVAVHRSPGSEHEVIVWDTDHILKMSDATFRAAVNSGVDRSTVVFFLLEKPETPVLGNMLGEEHADQLLDLAAAGLTESGDEVEGVHGNHAHCSDQAILYVPDSDSANEEELRTSAKSTHWASSTEFEWIDDAGHVTVDECLLQSLKEEAASYVTAAANGRLRQQNDKYTCPACPFRAFERQSRVQQHLSRYHTSSRQYCCSGTKQLRVILALHDSDQIAARKGGHYLHRSACLLRKSVKPGLSSTINSIDRSIRLLLDNTGPRLVHQQAVEDAIQSRRVGNVWYTHAFAERIFQEIMIHHAKASSVSLMLSWESCLSYTKMFRICVYGATSLQPLAGQNHLAAPDA